MPYTHLCIFKTLRFRCRRTRIDRFASTLKFWCVLDFLHRNVRKRPIELHVVAQGGLYLHAQNTRAPAIFSIIVSFSYVLERPHQLSVFSWRHGGHIGGPKQQKGRPWIYCIVVDFNHAHTSGIFKLYTSSFLRAPMDMLWFKFILGLNFIFFCFKIIIIHYHTQKQKKIKFKPRMKLNHNRYKPHCWMGYPG